MNRFWMLLALLLASFQAEARKPFTSLDEYFRALPGKTVFTGKPAGFTPYLDERSLKGEFVYDADSTMVTFTADGEGIIVGGQRYSLREAKEFPGGPDPDLFLYGAQVYNDESERVCIQANFAGLAESGRFQYVNSIILLDRADTYILSGLEASCTAFKKARNNTLSFPRVSYADGDESKRFKVEQLTLKKGAIKRKSLKRLTLADPS